MLPIPPDLSFLVELARQGAALAHEQLGLVARQVKRGEEAVTEADRAVQRLIVAGLSARWPEDGIIGEENDDGSAITNRAPRSGGRVWVIDPIDGTNNYISGYGAFAVCIGLLEQGRPVLGVVHDVARDETWAGAAGAGAWLVRGTAATPIAPRGDLPGPQSLLMMTSNLLVDGGFPAWAARLLSASPWKVRMLGSAALECVQVGGGTAYGAVTIHGKLWDVVAPAAVTLAAGGLVTRLDGSQLFPIDLTGYSGGKVPFVAAAPAALPAVLAVLR